MRSDEPRVTRFMELVNLSLGGYLQPGEAQELEEQLLDDPALRQVYLDMLFLETGFRRFKGIATVVPQDNTNSDSIGQAVFECVVDQDLADSAIRNALKADIIDETSLSDRKDAFEYVPRSQPFTRSQLFSALLSVAAVLIVATLLIYVDRWAWNRGASSVSQVVATLQDQIDSQWDQVLEYPFDDGRMKEGRYRLMSGFVEVRLHEGTQVVIEGPAEWSLLDVDQMNLHSGKVYATVPPEAVGFILNVEGAKLVDLGTEFAVKTGIGDTSEVHVIKGKVQLFAGADGDAKSSQTITENQAARYKVSSGRVDVIPIARRLFISRIDSSTRTIWRGRMAINIDDFYSSQYAWAIHECRPIFYSYAGGEDHMDRTMIPHIQKRVDDSVELVRNALYGQVPYKHAWHFDGSQGRITFSEIEIPEHSYTVSLWVKPDTIHNDQNILTIHKTKHQNDAETEYYWSINLTEPGRIVQSYMNKPTNADAARMYDVIESGYAIAAGQWSHVVLISDLSTRTKCLMINNSEKKDVILEMNVFSGTFKGLSLGRSYPGQSYEGTDLKAFSGGIAEVAYFNRALGSDEIRKLYEASSLR